MQGLTQVWGATALTENVEPHDQKKNEAKLVQADYRGWVARVLHDGILIGKAASNSSMIHFADNEYDELKALP